MERNNLERNNHPTPSSPNSNDYSDERYRGTHATPGDQGYPGENSPEQRFSQSSPPQGSYSAESVLLQRLTAEIDDLKQTVTAQTHQSSTEVNRLRRQVRSLTGILTVAVVLLGGALIGVSLNLRQEQVALRETQEEMIAQIEVLQTERMTSEQLSRLESLLNSLNETTGNLQGQARRILEQIPGASREQLENLQGELENLQTDVQDQLSQEEGGILDRVNSLYQKVREFLGNDAPEEGTEDTAGAEEST